MVLYQLQVASDKCKPLHNKECPQLWVHNFLFASLTLSLDK